MIQVLWSTDLSTLHERQASPVPENPCVRVPEPAARILRRDDFLRAAALVSQRSHSGGGTDILSGGIGTLGEKTLHAVLKHYFEAFEDSHEIPVGPFVADIAGEHGIIEIQTGGFERLRKKLADFLESAPVTVVYPVAAVKYLSWLDPSSGEISPPRKSPRRGSIYDAAPELYKIKPFLTHPNFRFCAVLLEIHEIRLLNGWSHDRKKGSRRYERIPRDIFAEVYAGGEYGFGAFMPPGLPAPFTVTDFAKATRISRRAAGTTVNLLAHTGAAVHKGKKGNAFLYEEYSGNNIPTPTRKTLSK